jgi:RNA polymerase sigma-70 factor (ECF subfamily)
MMNQKAVPHSCDLSDTELVNRILAGEKQLFELIMRRHNQRLFRIGMTILGNNTAVEEAMQTAYIKAYEHLQQFAQRSAFSTWLIRILLNECMAMKNSHQKIVTSEVDKQLENTSNMKTPATILLNKELANALEDALAQLPEGYRTVFVLRELEDMSVKETGELLGLEESNVKVRLNRAKTMLRQNLSGYLKENIYALHLSRCDYIVKNVMNALHIPY